MASSVSGIRAGKAYVEMGLQDGPLIKGLRKTESSLKSWGKGIAGVGAALGGMGAAITAPITAAAASFAEAGSALWDMSGRTGASVEALSSLGYAAAQTGTDIDAVEVGIKRMQKTLTAAALGSDEAVVALGQLGLSVNNLRGLSPEQQFAAIAKAIGAIRDPSMKAGAALTIFGRSGTALLPMIDDLDALTREAKDFGLVMSTDAAKSADALGDSMELLSRSIGTVVKTIGAAVAPAWTAWSISMARTLKTVKEFIAGHKPLIAMIYNVGLGLTIAGAAFIVLGGIIAGFGSVLGALATVVVTLGSVLGLVLSPLGMIAVAIAGAVYWSGAGADALAWLGESFSGLAAIATDTFKGISDAMTSGDIALAGQILWTGLRIVWLKGTNFLRQIWSDWGVWFVDSFASWQYTIAGFMTDMWDGVRVIWAQAMSDLFGSWGSLVSRMIRTFLPFSGILADIFGIDIEKSVNDALASLGVSGTDTTAQKKALDAELARIGQENLDKRKVLSDQQAAEAEARRRAADAGLEAGKAELTQAQEDLQSYLSTAKSEAGTVSGELAGGKPAMPEFSPDSLDAGLQQAAAKVDVKGSFSASALAGLGAGDTANDQLKEAKTSNKHLAKIAKKIDDAELAFT